MRSTDTRERLLDAALELFAERGYSRTSIGEIEAAAGLVPRSGGMYRHFRNKEALLRAAVEREIGSTDQLAAELGAGIGLAQSGLSETDRDPRTMLTAGIGVSFLIVGPQVRLRRIFASEDPVLDELSLRFRDVVSQTRGTVAATFARIAAQTGRTVDTEALAVFTAAAITQYVEDQSSRLQVDLGVTEERFKATLIDTLLAALGASGSV